MNAPSFQIPPRVSYRTGMLLDADDFTDEQNYHKQRLATVLLRLHGTGTVAGLKVLAVRKDDPQPEGGTAPEDEVRVEAGLAIDRRGRLLEVPTPRCLRLGRWLESVASAGAVVLKPLALGAGQRWLAADVFLSFSEQPDPIGLRPAFGGAGLDATDAVVAARLLDGFDLILAPRSAGPAGEPPPLPRPAFLGPPTTREDVLNAVFTSYTPSSAGGVDEYPTGPRDDTAAGIPARKLEEKTAVFLARILIRLSDAPATDLSRHLTNQFSVQNSDRLISPTAGLLFGLSGPA